ncbi:MAG: HAD domain-containing protein [Desulfobulbaceae bacterium]|nr:HAD domain-containing protein [Desulfobulbaceae bacterium]
MKQPIIFLDIDGVMNGSEVPYEESWGIDICPAAKERLNRLVEETGATVIISSSYRFKYAYPKLGGILGLKRRVVSGATGRDIGERWRQIQAYLSENPTEAPFIILDDTWGFGPLEDRHVWVDPEVGLQDADVDIAITLLTVSDPE